MDGVCKDNIVAVAGSASDTRSAFETIVNKHMKEAYFIALGFVGNHEDALELSQEAFYKAFRNFSQLRSEDKFFPWFYQILRNLCFSFLRKKRVRQAASLDDCCPEQADFNTGCTFDPEVIAQRNESKERLLKALARLDDKYREVIVLRHFRNLSYNDMSKVLFCSRGTVTSRLYYARKKLKELLDDEKGGQY